jgi:hypothetical protein
VAFSNRAMQEVIGYAAENSIKYYGQLAQDQATTYSQFWSKLSISQISATFNPFVYANGVVIKPTSPTTLNAQIPLDIMTDQHAELTKYFVFKTHPSETHMYLSYPGIFLNMDFSFDLKNGIPTISLANSNVQYYIQQNNNFSFFKRIKYFEYDVDIPYSGFFKSSAYKAFQAFLKSQLTTPRVANAFTQGLPLYTSVDTKINVSSKVLADYSYLHSYYYDTGFWIAEINGTLYTPGTQASQFSTVLPHFDSTKNSSIQMLGNQQILQQGVNLIPLKVNVTKVDIGTFLYNVNCTALNPVISTDGGLVGMGFDGECDVYASTYRVNIKFDGSYKLTPFITEKSKIGFTLNSALSQYNNQVVTIISGSSGDFTNDRSKIYSLLEQQIDNEILEVVLPLPTIRCVNDLVDGTINVKNGYLEVLLGIDKWNFCYLP